MSARPSPWHTHACVSGQCVRSACRRVQVGIAQQYAALAALRPAFTESDVLYARNLYDLPMHTAGLTTEEEQYISSSSLWYINTPSHQSIKQVSLASRAALRGHAPRVQWHLLPDGHSYHPPDPVSMPTFIALGCRASDAALQSCIEICKSRLCLDSP